MIDYKTVVLDNGLRVVVHNEKTSQMSAVNMLYCVGARDEEPSATGFAHLFEHLMFRGTKQVPDFDAPLQLACGENNAFTNNDYTDYYVVLPKDNIQTALWLESDRMRGLNINNDALESEKKVVVEEYNQRYLNKPYGKMWLYLRDIAYKVHPYRWATIGLTPQHIIDASLDQVKSFYDHYYTPENAILSICANMESEKMIELANSYFGSIPSSGFKREPLPVEPPQTSPRRLEVEDSVPAAQITIAFKMGCRVSRNFYQCDLISDILSGGTSSRLPQRLVKDSQIFSSVNAFITGDLDQGLFVVMGHLLPNVSVEQGEEALWNELNILKNEPINSYEMDKVKNKFEAGVLFGELNPMNKAMNLGFYTMLSDISLINKEVEIYRSITPEEIMLCARQQFLPERSSTLIFRSK